MALITKAADRNWDGDSLTRCVLIKGDDLKAGEAIESFDACYIKGSDGLVYRTITTVFSGGMASFDGLAYTGYATGDPVTLVGFGGIASYADSMEPGEYIYISATAGRLSDSLVLANDSPVAKAIEDDRILIIGQG